MEEFNCRLNLFASHFIAFSSVSVGSVAVVVIHHVFCACLSYCLAQSACVQLFSIRFDVCIIRCVYTFNSFKKSLSNLHFVCFSSFILFLMPFQFAKRSSFHKIKVP